jgi:hypothetical protein
VASGDAIQRMPLVGEDAADVGVGTHRVHRKQNNVAYRGFLPYLAANSVSRMLATCLSSAPEDGKKTVERPRNCWIGIESSSADQAIRFFVILKEN